MAICNFIQKKTGAKRFIFALFLICAASISNHLFAQQNPIENNAANNLPKVIQIDEVKLKEVLKPNGKPLLVNFWATWCDPCREEFPDLVKIDADYKGRIDLITISLDVLSEINRDVPKFLGEMKAEMPAYLLKTGNEDAAISSVSKQWQGGLPFTILFNEKGETVYIKQGKFKTETLRGELDKLLNIKKADETVVLMDFVKIKNGKRDEAIFYYENNWKIYREAAQKKGFIKSFEILEIAPNENNQFDLILITRYANEEQYKASEKNFEPILRELRPNGALLKNDLKPEDFRQNVFFNAGKPILNAGN